MDDQVLQSLLRSANRCELPSADAIERFIDEFHRRQALSEMKPSFFEKIRHSFETFFSHFQLPTLAYVSATAVAVFVSVLILRSPQLNNHEAINPLIAEETETPLNYTSSPAIQERIEPVTFELKKKNEESGDVVSPLSFILKRKSSSSSSQHFE